MSRAASTVLLALVLSGLAIYFLVVPPKGYEGSFAHRLAMPIVLAACAVCLFDNLRMRLHIAQLLGAIRGMMGRQGTPPTREVRAEAIGILLDALRSDRPGSRRAAADQLRRLTGEDFGEEAASWEAWWNANRSRFLGGEG